MPPSAPPNARFTLSRAKLLRTNLPSLAVSVESPLDAVRKSFVEKLSEGEAVAALASAPASDGSLPIFERAAAFGRAGTRPDLRAAAYEAALSSSRPATAVPVPVLSTRFDDSSPRIPVIRPLGFAGLPDTGCRQPDFSCGAARIAPAASRARER